jgi:D-alanyl-D-alanine carboxypeptidase
MKAWIVSVVTAIVVVVAGIGLWMTWDSTQTSDSQSVGRPVELSGDEAQSLTGDRRSDGDTGGSAGTPACTAGDAPVAGDPVADWATAVVDPGHRLPQDFEPPDLVDIGVAGFESTGDTVRQGVVSDLAALRQGAEANGTPFIVVSAYRSYEYQQRLFDNQVEELGRDAAEAATAVPGHSEHQLGTTIDVLDPAATELTPDFASTPAGQWITAHAHEYGFVMSYPNEASDQTCYDFEPWHLRYVGRDIAQQIHESGLTPREWMLSQTDPDIRTDQSAQGDESGAG